MKLQFINYYIFKDANKYISNSISTSSLENQSLFKYALFYNIGDYYKSIKSFKKGKYNITETEKKEKFPCFLLECMENSFNLDNNAKLFCYYIFMSYAIDKIFDPYIRVHINKRISYEYVCKMIDSYYFNKNEGISIHKTDITDYFFNSFSLSNEDINTISLPIKRVFGFFCIENYYNNCYNNCYRYFKYYAKPNILKKVLFKMKDIFLPRKNKTKLSNYMYNKKIDTKILNISRNSYIYNNEECDYNIDEIYDLALKETKKVCQILNNFYNLNKDLRLFNNYFNLNNEKSPK